MNPGVTSARGIRRGCAIAAAIVGAAILASNAAASPRGETEAGNDLFRQGKFAEARARYLAAQADAPDAPQLDLNIGAAFYNEGRLDEALKAFSAVATKPGADPKLLGSAAYDAGNALFKSGHLDEAVEAYKRALRFDPSDVDAKHNLELALEKREQQKQEQQNQDDSPGGEGQQDDKKEPSEGEGEKNEQDKQQQDGEEQQNDQQQGDPSNQGGQEKENSDRGEEQTSAEDSGEEDEQSDPAKKEDRKDGDPRDGAERESAQSSAVPDGAISKEDALRFLQALEAREMQAARERNEETLLKRLLDAGQDW